MILPTITACHHSVRSAIWLWNYLLSNTKRIDATWMPVSDGIWISDEQLAYRLDVTTATIKRWRKRSEKLGARSWSGELRLFRCTNSKLGARK